ncbi:MAG: glycosyl transferase [Isosphaeraceae bacterium]|nr:MAG: glycosyl transferase [Isosphaeraceae bacterium]
MEDSAGTSTVPDLGRRRVLGLATAILVLHYVLAAASLLRENATVDEVAHIPAGISYWQKGTFKLYHHNPPLARMVAALPVLAMRPETAAAYQSRAAWGLEYPAQGTFAQLFLALNADRYFELLQAARLIQPLWSVVGGVVVFAWSRRLWGDRGAVLSLTLWAFCPNILAHARLATTDIPAAATSAAATYLFWRYLARPTWPRALGAGLVLGLAQLTKFSALILYGLWPLIWLADRLLSRDRLARLGCLPRELAQGAAMVALSVLVIDVGYGFEGVGTPIGEFDFASRSFLTRDGEDPRWRTRPSGNPLLDVSWKHRVNRFRGTWLGGLPSPLPRHYLLGFDDQKIEADGIPLQWLDPTADPSEMTGYPVYLDGVLRRTGWRDYYLKTLLYKLPEGTWALLALALVAALTCRQARAAARDELALLVPPAAIFLAMTFLTDINIGLRYVLPIFPFLFIACGRLSVWAESVPGRARLAAWSAIGLPLAATLLSTLAIHPHYLAYFNLASGGPARGSEHLIDSNLDWGQDLVGLREWLRREAPDEPVGLAYFGQIPPSLFAVRGDGFEWFLPPVLSGRVRPMAAAGQPRVGPAPRLKPGLYAISASLVRGLPWRLHDPIALDADPVGWLLPSWNLGEDALGYFRELRPVGHVGYSIFLYRVTSEQAAALNARYWPGPPAS